MVGERNEKMKKKSLILTVLLVVALLLVGCGPKENGGGQTEAPKPVKTEAPKPDESKAPEKTEPEKTEPEAKVTGTVSTDGSTSMEKVIGALGEAFTKNNEGTKFAYNPTGSGSGIEAVKNGRCDIGLASRALKEEEKADGLVETTLALDGIAMIVSPDNPVDDLTLEQIADIYTGKITNWKDVGGNDAVIVVIGREAGSGTRDGFESVTKTKDACTYRQELTSTGDVITTVSTNPDAIGYASLASVKDSVKALKVNGVTPSEDTVRDGSYKLQRPFVLVTKKDTQLSAVAQKFFDFATSNEANDIISAAGVVPVK